MTNKLTKNKFYSIVIQSSAKSSVAQKKIDQQQMIKTNWMVLYSD